MQAWTAVVQHPAHQQIHLKVPGETTNGAIAKSAWLSGCWALFYFLIWPDVYIFYSVLLNPSKTIQTSLAQYQAQQYGHPIAPDGLTSQVIAGAG